MYAPHIAYYINLGLISMNIIINWYYVGITIVFKIIRFFRWVYSLFQRLYAFWKRRNYHKSDAFKQEQKRFYQEEQRRYDEQEKHNRERDNYEYTKRAYEERQQQEEAKQEHSYSSSNTKQKQEKQYDDEHAQFYSESFYTVLGVDIDVTFKEIKKAYRKLVREYHPDLNPEFEKEYTVIAQRINGAYEFFEKKNRMNPF